MTKLIESLQALSDALDAPTIFVEGPALQNTNQSELAKKYLTDLSQEVLKKKAYNQFYRDDTGTYICIYLTAHTKTENIEKAVEKICKGINVLSEKGLIHSTLSAPQSIELGTMPNQHPSSVAYSFVLVPVDQKALAESLSECACEEGTITSCMDDLKIPQPDGVAIHNYALGIQSTMFNKTKEELIQERIDLLTTTLPKGTRYLGHEFGNPTDLSIPVTMKFEHPSFSGHHRIDGAITTIEVDEVRIAWVEKEPEKVVQGNLFIGIRYLTAKGEDRYYYPKKSDNKNYPKIT